MGEHLTDFVPEWLQVVLVIWLFVLTAVICAAAIFGKDHNTPAEDNAQLAYLKAWTEAQHAKARRDTRGQKEAMDRVQRALHARLRNGV